MAGNLLPLLLIGGGALFLMSQKKTKTNGQKCLLRSDIKDISLSDYRALQTEKVQFITIACSKDLPSIKDKICFNTSYDFHYSTLENLVNTGVERLKDIEKCVGSKAVELIALLTQKIMKILCEVGVEESDGIIISSVPLKNKTVVAYGTSFTVEDIDASIKEVNDLISKTISTQKPQLGGNVIEKPIGEDPLKCEPLSAKERGMLEYNLNELLTLLDQELGGGGNIDIGQPGKNVNIDQDNKTPDNMIIFNDNDNFWGYANDVSNLPMVIMSRGPYNYNQGMNVVVSEFVNYANLNPDIRFVISYAEPGGIGMPPEAQKMFVEELGFSPSSFGLLWGAKTKNDVYRGSLTPTMELFQIRAEIKNAVMKAKGLL